MAQNDDNGNPPVYTVAEFAALIKRSRRTLIQWDKKGLLRAHRYPSGQPFYTHDQLLALTGQPPNED